LAIAKIYKLDPANPSTFGGTSLLGAKEFTLTSSADEELYGTDGQPFITTAAYSNISYQATVTGVTTVTSYAIGDTGTLVLKSVDKASGEGVGTAVKTYTSGTNCAVISNIEDTTSHAGESAYKLTFRLISVDGSTSPIARA
jgi:hypothetical protein